jgi:hypothetical protein
MDAPTNLPRLAQDYTPEQREACVTYLATLPLAELRDRQSIKNSEIGTAYDTSARLGWDTDFIDLLTSIQEQVEQITDAILRKLLAAAQ